MHLPLMGGHVAPHADEEFVCVGARGFDRECDAGRTLMARDPEEQVTKNLRITDQTVQ